MDDPEVIKDFLIESNENLARLDLEMVELEKRPGDATLLASIFRTIHTIKGTCGFLGFSVLERITHVGENLLSQVRNGERELKAGLVSLILEMVDGVKRELQAIERTAKESGDTHEALIQRLHDVCENKTEESKPQPEKGPVVEAEGGSVRSAVADSTIRVDVGLLDRLMNLVGELVLARNQILQFSSKLEDATFNATSQRLNLITTQLQEGVMKTRMQPIGVVWSKLPRVVRDLATSCSKQIVLEMDGAETELDKSIIEAIKDPLTHIVRNSCDHGIEVPAERLRKGKTAGGRLALRAFHEGGQVNIEISDDGSGIDPDRVKQKAVQKGLIRGEQAARMSEREAIHLVFHPGFSMAAAVTNISGRGVGMDVVKTNIEKIGGTVDVVSHAGQGTTVKIKIPLTLAIIPGLVVMSGGQRFVIPQVSLLELVRLEGEIGRKLIERIHGTPVYRRRGTLLPIADLNEVLRLGSDGFANDVINMVILQAEERQFGLVVDGIQDTQEIVVKPLGKQLKGLTSYAGATIMGDGKVALILDVLGIGMKSGVLSESRDARSMNAATADVSHDEKQSLLLFRSGRFERLAVPLSLVARLEEIPRAKIERASGRDVVQYRGRILPLIPLGGYLDAGVSKAQEQDPAQVVVFSDGDRRIGILVDQILDIVEDTVMARQKTNQPGLLGSAVVGQKVTDFVDLHAVLENCGASWFSQPGSQGQGTTVLIVDPSPFARGIIRNTLDMAGHRVVEASTIAEALEKLSRYSIGIVAAALDLPQGGAAALVEQMRSRPGLESTPVVALSNGEDPAGSKAHFEAFLAKFDREAMLQSIERLAAALDRAKQKQSTDYPVRR